MDWKTLLNSERPRPSSEIVSEHRIQFERDYDRTIFSTPVRRLQDKAQVFPLEPNDAVRTRLTHSLEVSTVSRGISRAVSIWLLNEKHIEPDMDRQIEAIAATCGLIHDLGNPPFGHSGEDAIREWFKEQSKGELKDFFENNIGLGNDFLNFDGNAQTLRLLTKLQVLADFNGLNLTFGTLSAACKYIASSEMLNHNDYHEYSKLGYFSSERAIIKRIIDNTGIINCRNPISFLVEASDDIVYSIVDIEDGIKKGILNWEQFESELKKRIPNEDQSALNKALETAQKIINSGNHVVENVTSEIHASSFRTAYISVLVRSVVEEFKQQYCSIMAGEYHRELVKECSARNLLKACKDIGREIIYCSSETLELELMGRRIIKDLLNLFWEGAKHYEGSFLRTNTFEGKTIALMSDNYKMVFRNNSDMNIKYRQLQLVTDHVCGMTDTFSCDLHRKLFNG
ncbi:MAG: dNTP triphosphohydrolase [Pseudomonadota bacterium]